MSEIKAIDLNARCPGRQSVSEFGFTVDGNALRFPLSGIKSLQSCLDPFPPRRTDGKRHRSADLFRLRFGRMKKYGLTLRLA
jgi:hypothetical protein